MKYCFINYNLFKLFFALSAVAAFFCAGADAGAAYIIYKYIYRI
jgi:hypothetical protein